MYEISVNEIDQFLRDGRQVAQYAWDHYEELVTREKMYTLYGPYEYGIGAGIPGKFIPSNSRKLTKQTRRKNYVIYELDSSFRLLRTVTVRDYTKVESTYHCFDYDGVQYAYPFRGTDKKSFKREVLAIRTVDQKPQYWAAIGPNSVLVHFFEHIDSERMAVTLYSYTPTARFTVHGYPVDHSAPIGALNSPVERGYWEEPAAYTDFSAWF